MISYSFIATSGTLSGKVLQYFSSIKKNLPKQMHIPTILGTRYFRDRSRYLIRVQRPKKPPEAIFALFYTKMNKISRRRCAYPPSCAPGISGIEADVIFVLGELKNPRVFSLEPLKYFQKFFPVLF